MPTDLVCNHRTVDVLHGHYATDLLRIIVLSVLNICTCTVSALFKELPKCTGIFSHNSPTLHPPSRSLCISPVCFSDPSYHPVIHYLLTFPSHIRHIGTMLHHLSCHLVIFCMALSLSPNAFGQGSTGHTVSLVNKLCICFHSSPVDVYSYVNEIKMPLNCDCSTICSWRLNGTEIDYNSYMYLFQGSRATLFIRLVNVSDEGTYTCLSDGTFILNYSLVVPGMLTIVGRRCTSCMAANIFMLRFLILCISVC